MRRLAAIFFGVLLFIAVLAYYQPILGFFEYFYQRPYQNLSDDQLRIEISAAESLVAQLAEQSMGLANRPAAPGNAQSLSESWAEVNKASTRLRQLRAELAFRVDRVRYYLIAGFAFAFIVFFLFFRDAYLSALPGTHDREQMKAERDREQGISEPRAPTTLLEERLGRIDPRLLRLHVGQSSPEQVAELLGPPAGSTQERVDETLTYVFDTMETPPGATEPRPARVAVMVVVRGGVVTKIKVKDPEAGRPISSARDS